PLTQGQTVTLQVGGSNTQAGGPSQVPASGASAVILNLAATGSTAPGDFLTLWPADPSVSRPTTSNLNFTAGQTKSNRVVVKLGPTGAIKIYNPFGSVQVIVDVNGWFTDGAAQITGVQFTGVSPLRILDTRDGTGGYTGPLPARGTLSVIVAGRGGVPGMDSPAAPAAVVMNVTATDTTAGSFFTIYPSDAQQPVIADLNWPPGGTIPNLVVVKLSPDGRANVFSFSGSVDVIADVVGWYN
ncbi:MAG TPA: hypothetical protein VKI19_10425, partial [Acidimicrobiales bacterium]|nr:hypothetical protein [Acidimicrobiales bacterium]